MGAERILERLNRRSRRKNLHLVDGDNEWADADAEIQRLHEAGELGKDAANGQELRDRLQAVAERNAIDR